MPHPQGCLKDSETQPSNNPNKDHDPQVAPIKESKEIPPWVVPPKLPSTLEGPTEEKAKGKTHLQQVPEWVASSKALLLGHYGVTDCRVEGCCNLGCAWSKGKDLKEYYCNNHRQLLKQKHREQSARCREK